MQINLISLYLLASAVVVLNAAVSMRALSGSFYCKAWMLLSFAVCFYILGYTMELNAATPAQILFWNRIQYIGIPYVSALWLTIGLFYMGRLSRRSIPIYAAIYVIPVCTMIIRLTNPYHGLYFATESFVVRFGVLHYVRRPGPWYYVQLLHSGGMVLTTLTYFIKDFAKSPEKEPGKTLLISLASAFAIAGLGLSLIKPFNLPLDYMALCLPITCVTIITAISRYDLLKIKSMARAKAFDANSDAILLINRQHRLVDYNRSAKMLFDQLNLPLNRNTLTTSGLVYPALLEALEKPTAAIVKLQINDVDRFYSITTESFDKHKNPRSWFKTIRDVTEVYQLNEELNRLAMTDELSVLSNRRAFIKIGKDWVEAAEQSGSSLHLLMMDLDRFKTVNDRFGHLAGDMVIWEFAQLLKTHFTGGLVARLGGEEFAVLLSDFADDELNVLLDTFMKAAEQHLYAHLGNFFHVTVSVGLTKKLPGQSLEKMMGIADNALYESKEQGRNRITVL